MRTIRKSVILASLCLFAGCIAALCHAAVHSAAKPTKQILFVCTGNYYRSRFAEVLFNEKARELNSSWTAVSRGLALVGWQHGVSKIALRELQRRGVPSELCKGTPQALTRADLEKSDYIVFMDEKEHRSMFEKNFPKFNNPKIHYWHIPDGSGNCTRACQLMSKNVDELVRDLSN